MWNETITAHRAAVQDAILDTAAALAAEHGPTSVTMSQIAEQAGIGRATLYKYFPDVEAILVAWHQRNIARHLAQLTESAAGLADTPGRRLQAVLETFAARIAHQRPHRTELATLVHRDEHMAGAQQQLLEFITGLIAEAADAGEVRSDVAADELAGYCLHALTAARTLRSDSAVSRLVTLTMAGLRPPG